MPWWLADLGLKGKTNAQQLSNHVLDFLASTGRVPEVVLDTGAILWTKDGGRTGQPSEDGVIRVYILSADQPYYEDGAMNVQSAPLPVALVYLGYDPNGAYPPHGPTHATDGSRDPREDPSVKITELEGGGSIAFDLD